MSDISFSDILYGEIQLPSWIEPFLTLPEFLRLRGVRLSNVDSYQFKDFASPTRWEHGVAVAALAKKCAKRRGLNGERMVHLILAALLHDVATPPFAHTAEFVLPDFDHEVETQRLLGDRHRGDATPEEPVYASQTPQFRKRCMALSRKLGHNVEPDEVARLVCGEGQDGFLIAGTLDLDNADNVTRACLYMGIQVDRRLPFQLADWLASQERIPDSLEYSDNAYVKEWLSNKKKLYFSFDTAGLAELGRQAFLQHLMRRALSEGLTRDALIWQTDESLLVSLGALQSRLSESRWPSMRELVERYRLLEQPCLVAQVDIDNPQLFETLSQPQVTNWLEQHLSSDKCEAMVFTLRVRRGSLSHQEGLFPEPTGRIMFFKLGGSIKRSQLPGWLQTRIPERPEAKEMKRAIGEAIRKEGSTWSGTRPWLVHPLNQERDMLASLNCVGNWSFRLSRNENLHAYPSTFVHAIPATLIGCLGLRGELVVDPFGGTGQTALEAVRQGGRCISTDACSIAALIARTRLTYLTAEQRRQLLDIDENQLRNARPVPPQSFDRADRWFHPETMSELCQINGFIDAFSENSLREFLTTALSAILTSCTARFGKQHGFFADNTPLAKDEQDPPKRDAFELFLHRLRHNVRVIEGDYAGIRRLGREPGEVFTRATVIKLDCTRAKSEEFGIEPNSAAAIITSPPYLCMSDYTLGNRLSYYWLNPEALQSDFNMELGPRRARFQAESTLREYEQGMEQFALLCTKLLQPGGYVAMVMGEPTAKEFKEVGVLRKIDEKFMDLGFKRIWEYWRVIHWHRNYGYVKVKRERLSVHKLVTG